MMFLTTTLLRGAAYPAGLAIAFLEMKYEINFDCKLDSPKLFAR